MRKRMVLLLLCWLAVLCAGCQDSDGGSGEFSITVDADGTSRVYRYDKKISVGQFLEEIGVTLNELDQVNPPLYTQLIDDMRITVSRVVEKTECREEVLPYESREQATQGLPPGERRIMQTGENGTLQICYRITEKDGEQISRDEISRIPIKASRDEIVYVGSEPPDTLMPIDGVLTYISAGQAWLIQGNTTKLRPLTMDGRLDGRVFELSADGRNLLYTQSTADETDPEFSNELWAIFDTTANPVQPVQLVPSDVRYAQWMTGQPTPTISYSNAVPVTDVPNWQAYNDLFVMQLDADTGQPLDFEEVIPSNALGIFAYWGRRYLWSPDGTRLAWALADSVGIVNLEAEDPDFVTLLSFPEYATALDNYWVWVPKLSWTEDGYLLTTVHGEPYGSESPEDSIIFDIAVVDTTSDLKIDAFMPESGIWSTPTYSPPVPTAGDGSGYLIAYFKAREPLNSPGSQYDLWVADSDGSNARLLFPGLDRAGIRPDPEDGIAWSPQGRQIAVIHQKNLWIIDVDSGLAHQITSDGQASRPRWSLTR